MSSLVALILGAGPNVGHHVAKALQSQKYKVALGSRNPDVDKLKKDGFFPVKVDITLPDSVSAAYKTVSTDLGTPNVVVFNAAVWRRPEIETDPLSLPLEDFKRTLTVSTSVYSAAQDVLKGFRSLTSGPKAFIVTGNALPFLPHDYLALYDLQTLKVVEAHLSEVFWNAYIKEGIRFHYALLVSQEGTLPAYNDFKTSGPAHATAYWELISSEKPKGWDYKFTLDGKKWNKTN
ncbi:uncharacterized protein EV420DRAFT_876677 [Desarmillaria tabescens]|uniref:NAD(P)-binding protein n=1 Tax=Armillaria tabescens TaxID=1929756 RepID=A0AA39JTD6_ARMTA|nr:uncharacterized protein EV420DRAFT_876677 [Desarmillaria tabescens]KAK0447461.1 hypothetical protein EV420DRAFT_876677 [Desarmillaria tabescens]